MIHPETDFAGGGNAGATAGRLRTGFERCGEILRLGKSLPPEIVRTHAIAGRDRRFRAGPADGEIFEKGAEFHGHTLTVEASGLLDALGLVARLTDRDGNALVQAACALSPPEEADVIQGLREAATELRALAMRADSADRRTIAALQRAELLDRFARDAERLSRAPTGAELAALREAAE